MTCEGCTDDFYNGKNNLGVKQCWNLKTATVVKTICIGIMERPPYIDKIIEERLSCYKCKGFVYVKIPNQESTKKTYTLERW